jgi:hypothetical protein
MLANWELRGEVLARAREAADLSQEQLASAVRVSSVADLADDAVTGNADVDWAVGRRGNGLVGTVTGRAPTRAVRARHGDRRLRAWWGPARGVHSAREGVGEGVHPVAARGRERVGRVRRAVLSATWSQDRISNTESRATPASVWDSCRRWNGDDRRAVEHYWRDNPDNAAFRQELGGRFDALDLHTERNLIRQLVKVSVARGRGERLSVEYL